MTEQNTNPQVNASPTPVGGSFTSSVADKVHKSPTPGSHPNVTAFNPRSCVTCRRRKVKCNKSHPCSNCVKAHIDCIYPAPGRAPRRPRKPPDAELLARLRRLEGVVKTLGVPVDEAEAAQLINPSGDNAHGHKDGSRWSPASSGAGSNEQTRAAKLGHDFGRLVINDGRSRYVNNPVWATLSSEVQDLKGILDESSSEESSYPSPSSTDPVSPPRDAFVFGMSSSLHDLSGLMPAPDMIAVYWDVYKERCDPVMKTLHIPTMSETVQNVISNGGKASKGLEALMFAIYLVAVASLPEAECRAILHDEKSTLLARYRYGTEQALSRAHFLVTEEIQVLQAFVIMLVSLRRLADPRALWSLCGLACRIALTIGLHRDGTNFGISPFETEMRRRVWWQVFLLDTRSSEDHGTDPSISDTSFDTQLPLNVNDEDLSPDMTNFPEPKKGFTEMTFCLLRYEMATSFRKFQIPQMPGLPMEQLSTMAPEEKERIIEECHQYLEEKYLRHCDMNIPLQWAACTVARLIMAKQWIILYNPADRAEDGSAASQAMHDKVFITCVDSLEHALVLHKEQKAAKWGWMYRSYNQWHGMVFLLTELKKRTKGPLIDRAWRAVDATVVTFGEVEDDKKKGHLWKPLQKLFAAAKLARQRQLASEKRATNGGMRAAPPQSLNERNLELLSSGIDKMNRQVSTDSNGSATNGININYYDPSNFPANPREANMNGTLGSVPNSYVWDNVSNQVPVHSQFFANQPSIPSSQWQDLTGNANGGPGVIMSDWFSDFNAGQRTNPNSNVPSAAATPASHDAFANGIPNGVRSAYTSNPPSIVGANGANEDLRSLGVGASPPMGNFSDPMVSGGRSEDGGVQWEDWDSMMREFETNGNQAQWGRRPVLEETWL